MGDLCTRKQLWDQLVMILALTQNPSHISGKAHKHIENPPSAGHDNKIQEKKYKA